MHDGVRAFGGLVGLDGWKGAEDMGGVLKEDTCHDKDGAKIGVIADDNFRLLFAIHQAKRGENHRQAKSDETEATDGGNNMLFYLILYHANNHNRLYKRQLLLIKLNSSYRH